MTRLLYFLRKALFGIRTAPFVHLVAAITMAVALTLSAMTAGVGFAADALLSSWGLRAELTLYLDDAIAPAEGERIAQEAARIAEGEARFVTPREAIGRLATLFGEDGEALLAIEQNPLPPSVEVVPGNARSVEQVEQLGARLSQLAGVAEVDHGAALVERVGALTTAARAIGAILLPLVLLGAAVLAGSVVRLGVYARREEIEILKLVGATDAFVRAPFLLEGLLSGALGGLLAAGALSYLAQRLDPVVRTVLPPELSASLLAAPASLAGIVAVGALLGLVSSALSVGRHLRV